MGGQASPGARVCVGAEESTVAHVEVDAAVSRRPSICSGQEHMLASLLSFPSLPFLCQDVKANI